MARRSAHGDWQAAHTTLVSRVPEHRDTDRDTAQAAATLSAHTAQGHSKQYKTHMWAVAEQREEPAPKWVRPGTPHVPIVTLALVHGDHGLDGGDEGGGVRGTARWHGHGPTHGAPIVARRAAVSVAAARTTKTQTHPTQA